MLAAVAAAAGAAGGAGRRAVWLNAQRTLRLTYGDAGAAGQLRIDLEAAVPADVAMPGYLAVGWSPDGQMHDGDWVLGYTGCVRALRNNATKGDPPAGPAPFPLSGASFEYDAAAGAMRLGFARPAAAGRHPIAPGGGWLLFAAGSAARAPAACDSALSAAANKHDLWYQGLTGASFLDLTSASGCGASQYCMPGAARCATPLPPAPNQTCPGGCAVPEVRPTPLDGWPGAAGRECDAVRGACVSLGATCANATRG